MRKNFSIFLIPLLFLFNCSTSKAKIEKSSIDSYLEQTGIGKNEIMVILDKKIPNKKTISIFKGTSIFNPQTNKYGMDGRPNSLYNINDWEKMNTEYNNDTIAKYWTPLDFENKKIKIEKYILFDKNLLANKYSDNNLKLFAFSDPILYGSGQYILFTVLQSDTTVLRQISEFVIVMKKENNRWKVVEKINSDIIYH